MTIKNDTILSISNFVAKNIAKLNAIVLKNDGDIATPLTIEVLGKSTNPSYFLKQNDILVGNGKV